MVKRDSSKADKVVSDSMRARVAREQGYREKALKMYPHVCGRCGREFAGKSLKELTVHHRNHDHDYNPEDGSNWELLCVYCHDNEHQRQVEAQQGTLSTSSEASASSTHNPFADLKSMLEKKKP